MFIRSAKRWNLNVSIVSKKIIVELIVPEISKIENTLHSWLYTTADRTV